MQFQIEAAGINRYRAWLRSDTDLVGRNSLSSDPLDPPANVRRRLTVGRWRQFGNQKPVFGLECPAIRYGYGFCNQTLRLMQQKTGKGARDLPLVHEPGTRWTYGMGTRILGEIVEVASEQKLDEFLDAHVVIPPGHDRHEFHPS